MLIDTLSIPGKRITPGQQIPAISRGLSPSDILQDGSTNLLTLRDTFLFDQRNRSLGVDERVDISQGEVVELIFEDDTVWLSNGDTLSDVFGDAVSVSRSLDGSFMLPLTLESGTETRGILGKVALKIVNIFTRKAIGSVVETSLHQLAQNFELKQLQTASGLFQVGRDFTLRPFTISTLDGQQPYLLFLHGTASSTLGSFGTLQQASGWAKLAEKYGPNMLAFQHESLSQSPLQNTLTLLQSLPEDCVLHVVTHSRGGLIGELLCRFTNSQGSEGFDALERGYLAKCDRQADLDLIDQIEQDMQRRRIQVARFVRVACPAQGTTLASGRLDRFFNVSLNLLGLATGLAVSPAYSAFKDLVAAVLDTKNNQQVLPGLEAMNPDSPFIKVLNNPNSSVPVDSPLHIVAGNCRVKPSLKALLILASKLFYLRQNDLVVDTESMYQGSKRTKPVYYYFDAAPDTDHFHYFQNGRTATMLLTALLAAEQAVLPEFQLLSTRLPSVTRNALLKLEGGKLQRDKVTGKRPIVLLLPGIMGSVLEHGNDRLWIDYWGFMAGELVDLAIGKLPVAATGVVRSSYEQLADHLSDRYDVVTFGFDWRQAPTQLAQILDAKIQELLRHRQPLKIIAHSMGGVVMRDLMIFHPSTWQTLNQSGGFRLLLLGSPLQGSYRIPALLLGRDSVIQKLSKLDLRHTKEELLAVFNAFPGVLGLLPHGFVATEGDLALPATWQQLAATTGNNAWPVPAPALLQEFATYREQVQAKIAGLDYSNVVYVAGRDRATPNGYRLVQRNGQAEVEFTYTAAGDQSVTWASGIPSQLEKAGSVYYVNVTHGALANEPAIFAGLAELLASGSTRLLSRTQPQTRGGSVPADGRQHDDFDLTPAGVEQTLLGLTSFNALAEEETTALPALQVFVSNGDLRYASYPLLAGHFATDGILYAEKDLDQILRGALSERHKLGIYPERIGSSELFTSSEAGFAGAIIVGLGPATQLTAYRLTATIEQAVSKYLHNIATGNVPCADPDRIGVSALLIASGYGGLTLDGAARAILVGVQNANRRIRKIREGVAPRIHVLEFVEVYTDKAISCYHTLMTMERESRQHLHVAQGTLRTVFGAKKRLLADAGANWWNRLNVRTGRATHSAHSIELQFSFSAGAAREDQRTLLLNHLLVRQLLEELSVQNAWSATLAKTVFELLIPNDLKESLQRQSNLTWILDKDTAEYPWELLQDGVLDAKPLCVNAGMVRQLTTPTYRQVVVPVSQETALVVGDPELESFAPQLPGARAEAEWVRDFLRGFELDVTANIAGRATGILRNLLERDYKIIHLAGHGVFKPNEPSSSGMLIGRDLYLTTQEIIQMSTVPELVFVNCCYLGQTDAQVERRYQERYRLAANIGMQLIDNGVRAVVVAGWAIGDAEGLAFAQTFYEKLFAGFPFGEALLAARRKVYEDWPTSNTWGAYQAYGDPFYKYGNSPQDTRPSATATSYVSPEQAEIELVNLYNAVESGRYAQLQVVEQLQAISARVDESGVRIPEITELEARIYLELYLFEPALRKFEELLQTEHSSYAVAMLEQYCYLRARYCVRRHLDQDALVEDTLQQIERVLTDLLALHQIGVTAERLILLGSTNKRKTLVTTIGTADNQQAYADAAYYYRQASQLAQNSHRVYCLANWYILEALADLHENQVWPATKMYGGISYSLPTREDAFDRLQKLAGQVDKGGTMDYWHLVECTNVRLCELLLFPGRISEDTEKELLALYNDSWQRAGSLSKKMAGLEFVELLHYSLEDLKVQSLSQKKGMPTHKQVKALATLMRNLYARMRRLLSEQSV